MANKMDDMKHAQAGESGTRQTHSRQTVGIRELKQNPSEVVARAASGVQFDVLSNGKPVGVVIQREANLRSRWVSTDAMKAMVALARTPGHSNSPGHSSATGLKSTGGTGWAEELQAQRELDDDRILDPWDADSKNAGPA